MFDMMNEEPYPLIMQCHADFLCVTYQTMRNAAAIRYMIIYEDINRVISDFNRIT